MTQLLTGPGTGLEHIGRETCIILIDYLPAELQSQEDYWDELDKSFDEKREIVYQPITLEKMDKGNILFGHNDSLIQAPVDMYPNVAVMAFDSSPSEDQGDQYEIHDCILVLELMVKANYDDGPRLEELLNKRTYRTMEAVVSTIAKHSTLNGLLVSPIVDAPSVFVSNIFARSEFTGHGEEFLWQGARIEYLFEKPATYGG